MKLRRRNPFDPRFLEAQERAVREALRYLRRGHPLRTKRPARG